MKILPSITLPAHSRRRAFGLAVAVLVGGFAPAATCTAGEAKLLLAGPANAFAEKFLVAGKTDEELPAFLKQHSIETGAFADSVKTAVALGRAAQQAGLKPGSPPFRAVLAASHSDEADNTGPGEIPAATAEPKPSPETEADLRSLAAKRLRGTSATRQYFLAHTVGVEPPGFPSYDPQGHRSDLASPIADEAWRKAIADPTDTAKTSAAPGYDAFLLRYGARLRSYEKKPAPAADTETAKKSAAAAEGSDAVQKTLLRDAGFSVGYGFGMAVNTDGDTLTPALFRWNLLQRRSTIMWNDLVAEGNKANTRKRISYFGKSGAALIESKLGPNARSEDVARLLDYRFPYVTTCGPFLGRSLGGQKIWFGATDSDGARVLESPFIAGWSVGFGFIDEAASAVCLDVGATASPSSGFRHSKPYVGISVDGIVAGKLLELLRLPALAGGSAE